MAPLATARSGRAGLTRLLRDHLVTTEDAATAALIRQLVHVRRCGEFTHAEFLRMCRWKSPRAAPRCAANSRHRVRRVSRAVFQTADDALRLVLLTSLGGVGVPTASAILTLTDPRRYGVIDIRAWQVLHGVGAVVRKPSGIGFRLQDWLDYLTVLRREARALRVTARQVEYTLFCYHEQRHRGVLYRR